MRRSIRAMLLVLLASCDGSGTDVDGGRDASLRDGGPRIDGAVRSDAAGLDAAGLDAAGLDAADRDAGAPDGPPDPSTLEGKLMFGYQGWFTAEGDGARVDRWAHWAGGVPDGSNVTFDAWPDLTDYVAAGVPLYDTNLHLADGSVARLYSAYDPEAVDLHFAWMEEHGLDGVFLQMFVGELTDGSDLRELRDRVAQNVLSGAEAHDRVFAIEYDLSGADPSTLVATIRAHWEWVVNDLRATASPRYVHHRGRPVVAVWGPGFTDRAVTPAVANALLDYFENDAPEPVTVMGGVPSSWRTLDGDSRPDPAWSAVYARYDVLSPWLVGRFADEAGATSFVRDRVRPDIALCQSRGQDYMPTAFPGFSWTNLMRGMPLNQIPRLAGRFYWTQLRAYTDAGATMVFSAMFDEVDEGTAMFELAPTTAETPVDGRFLALDADGYSLPSDFYLRLAGLATRALHRGDAFAADPPIGGGTPMCSPPDTMEVMGRCVPSCGAAGGDSCDPAVCASRPHLESYDCAVCCDSTP
ncbi:MAG: glycoside hydrolase family 71/99-like protein [Sandaracinaceae bacterium]